MRLDKFLKVTRLIKRRTIAQELCDNGKVFVNDKPQKPSYSVKENDIINFSYFNNEIKIRVLKIPENLVKTDLLDSYIEIIKKN